MDQIVFLNGEFLPLGEAKVPVLDRGFIFGDGVYEVVPVYGRRLFRFNEHMARLARSLERVRIPNPHGTAEWLERCRRVVAARGFDDQLLYLQVTRGVAPREAPTPTPPPYTRRCARPCCRTRCWSSSSRCCR